jgi:glutamate decarboxylase
MISRHVGDEDFSSQRELTGNTYGERWMTEPVPKFSIPERSMEPRAAYQIIHDEMNLDGNPALNLASFVTTWMEPEAEKIMVESLNKNFIDQDEYPQTKVIHDRVISMMANLFNAPDGNKAIGTATIGSSEAIMLGLLAHKWSWRKKREKAKKDASKPNLVFGADVHSCWEKFALYFDVEMRIIPMKKNKYTINADDVSKRVDENTIAVGAVLGTTFTGQVDDILGINDFLVKLKNETGLDIPMHVDGASGGFIAPFVFPDLEWDFRLEQVKSINISNHKFGLVYPGMGTVLFRDESVVPEELIFHINYLGGEMPNYSLNFSRASSIVLLQYYNFIRLGIEGYSRIMKNIMNVASFLEEKLMETGHFKLLTDTKYLPVVAVCLKKKKYGFDVFQLSDALRERGWIIPAYTLPADAQDIAVLRMVVKENFSRDMAESLAEDVEVCIAKLEKASPKKKTAPRKKSSSRKKTKTTVKHPIC